MARPHRFVQLALLLLAFLSVISAPMRAVEHDYDPWKNKIGDFTNMRRYAARLETLEPLEGGVKRLTFHANQFREVDLGSGSEKITKASRDFKVTFTDPERPVPFAKGFEYEICTRTKPAS